MNLFSKSLILLVVLISFQHIIAQTYPQLAGTWYINGQADAPCLITQSQQYLNFSYSSNQSKGYFTQSGQIYASDWNAYANLSTDGNTITWNNQNWTRYPTMNYGDIGGTWYVNGDQANVASISQTGKNLNSNFQMGVLPDIGILPIRYSLRPGILMQTFLLTYKPSHGEIKPGQGNPTTQNHQIELKRINCIADLNFPPFITLASYLVLPGEEVLQSQPS